jgi:hypothetical protein
LAIFLQAGVLAGISLLLSTFSTSTLFTTIVAFLVYFMGYLQADARDFWLHGDQAGQTATTRAAALVVALVLPDFHLYNIVDAVIQGQAVQAAAIGKLAGISVLYMAAYVVLSWFVFSDKEF